MSGVCAWGGPSTYDQVRSTWQSKRWAGGAPGAECRRRQGPQRVFTAPLPRNGHAARGMPAQPAVVGMYLLPGAWAPCVEHVTCPGNLGSSNAVRARSHAPSHCGGALSGGACEGVRCEAPKPAPPNPLRRLLGSEPAWRAAS